MATTISKEATQAYGRWLADQEWKLTTGEQGTRIVDEDNCPLVAAVTAENGAQSVPLEQVQQALHLMRLAPRMLRFMLRALETLDSPALSSATKNEHVRGILTEVVEASLQGLDTPRAVARAVQHRQASRK